MRNINKPWFILLVLFLLSTLVQSAECAETVSWFDNSSLVDMAIFGDANVLIEKGVQILDGPIVSNGRVMVDKSARVKDISAGEKCDVDMFGIVDGSIISNGITTLNKQVNVYGDIDAAEAVIEGSSAISGDVTASGTVTLKKKATVSGTVTQFGNPEMVTEVILPPATAFSTDPSNNISTQSGDTTSLPPGKYGELMVGPDNKLTFSAGDYYFESINTAHGLDLNLALADGEISIFVKNNVNLGNNLEVFVNGTNVSTADHALAADVYMEIHGQLQLHNNGQWLGTIFAPNDKVVIHMDSLVIGAIYSGSSVRIKKDSTMHFVSSDHWVSDVYPPVISALLVYDTGREDLPDSYHDRLTSDPNIIGTITDDSDITVVLAAITETAGMVDITSSIDPDGSFVFAKAFFEALLGGPMIDGNYTLRLQAEDEHGNISGVFALPFALDTTAPGVEIPDLRISSDTGISVIDNITNDNTPTLDVDTEVDALVELAVNSTPYDQSITGPLYSFTTGPLPDGIYDFSATAQDMAGNLGVSPALSVQIDTVAPIITLLLDPASDTGTVGDDITAMAIITLVGETDPTRPVELAPTGAVIISDDAGGFTFTDIPLTMGANPCTAVVTDIAGNSGQAERTITRIEVIPPVISASLVNDTGRADLPSTYTDRITSDPAISGVVSDDSGIVSVSAGIDGSAIMVDVTSAINTDGSFVFDRAFLEGLLGSTMIDGSYTLRMQAGDVYGNTSGIFVLAFTLDTTAPIVDAPDLSTSSDTGSSASDNITADNTPTIDVNTETGTLVTIAINGSSDSQSTAGPLYSFTPGPLTDGLYSFAATAQDIAGNLGTSSALVVQIDTVAPNVTLSLGPAFDTGIVGDDITKAAIITLIGQTEPDIVVELVQTASLTTSDGTGAFSFAGVSLVMGANPFTAVATDIAGNSGQFERTITRIEANPPSISASLVNDTGRSDLPESYLDGLTSDPTISGNIDDDSSIGYVQAAIDDSADMIDVTASINPDGSFTFDRSFFETLLGVSMADGNYTLRIQAEDAFGNTSSVFTLSFGLDTIAPVVEVPDLRSSSDTGSSDVDNITSDNTPAIDVDTEADALVALLIGGSPVGQSTSGPLYSFTAGLLADGLHNITATAQDITGNIGTSPVLAMQIDTVAPFVDLALAEESDTGEIGDSVTTLENVTLIATTETNTPVSLYYADDLTSPIAAGTSDPAGQLRFENIALDTGDNNFAVAAVDPAGNEGIAQRTIVREDDTLIYLVEGTNFEVFHEEMIQVPDTPGVLNITYQDLNFDATDDFVNDAFEVALLDENGQTLVYAIANGRDSFFNITEGMSAQLADGVALDGQTIMLDLSGIPAGTNARLVLRLVNNDADTTTSVRIMDISLTSGSLLTPLNLLAESLTSNSSQTGEVDFAMLSDITSSVHAVYGLTSFNETTDTLFAGLALRNSGSFEMGSPLIAVVDHLSDASVHVKDADGFTPDGKPYYDFSSLIAGGILEPLETTSMKDIVFSNPNGVQFAYDLVIYGKLNGNPNFTSIPRIEALANKTYQYDSDAADPDGDDLTYSLSTGPAGMNIDPTTGIINWNPSNGDVGNHSVFVQVQDGRGGSDTQDYLLSVHDNVPNRPPVFTSVPIVDAYVNTPYSYDAEADDPDQDPLSFALIEGPDGAVVDSNTGIVNWTPIAEQAGVQQITIQVNDGNGGIATQPYSVYVHAQEGNHPPIIISEPVTTTFYEEGPIILPPGSSWEYTFIDPTLDANWNRTTGGWDSGAAPFGTETGPFNEDTQGYFAYATYWPVVSLETGDDLWVRTAINLSNYDLSTIKWNMGVDNGFKLYLNGTLVTTHNMGGYTYRWEYTGAFSVVDLVQGMNIVAVALEDHGGSTAFDMQISGELKNTYDFEYTYDVDAVDPDQDEIVYSLVQGPDGMTINELTGELIWNPTVYHIGNHPVTVEANDGRGGFDEQSFTIDILPETENQPPEIISDAVTTVVPGQEYVYDVEAIDPDDDPLVYSLSEAPAGMVIDPDTGFITWSDYELIPPVLDFAITSGQTSDYSFGGDVALDPEGNVYSTGKFEGTFDFDPGEGTHYLNSNNGAIYISKSDSSGNLIWAYNIGPSSSVRTIKLDSDSNIYICGTFQGTVDFDHSDNVYNLGSHGGYDIFVLKLDADGNFIWAQSAGGTNNAFALALAVDYTGSVYTTGFFYGTVDFDPGDGVSELVCAGAYDGFVWKLDSDGNFVWVHGVSGPSKNVGHDIATDDNGNVYVVGNFMGTVDFDPDDSGIYELTSAGSHEAFVWKLDYAGNLIWAGKIGGGGIDQGQGIAVDRNGYVYVTGEIGGIADLDPGDGVYYNSESYGGYDIFVCKLDPEGDLVWAHNSGSSNHDVGADVIADMLGNVYVVGDYQYTVDFDPGLGTHNLTSNGSHDAFVWKLDSNGDFLNVWSFGSSDWDSSHRISMNNTGEIAFYSTFRGTDSFEFGDSTVNLDSGGSHANVIIKFSTLNLPTDVTVNVEDGRGGFDEQSFTLNVCEDPADLVVSDVDTSGLVYDGQALTVYGEVSAAVTNLGPADISVPFDVLFFEDRDYNGVYDQGIDSFLGQTTISDPLAVDGTVVISAELTGSVLFSGNIVWGFVDSGNVICETDENNNLAQSGSDCIFIPPVGQFNPVIEWSKSTFDVMPESKHVKMTPAVADLNGDGIPEIIFATYTYASAYGSALRAVNGSDGSSLWNVTDPAYIVDAEASLAIGDIDNDGKPEIVTMHRTGVPIAFEHDGTFKWMGPELWGGVHAVGISIANIDHSGLPEIIIGANVLNADGTLRWRGDTVGGVGQGSNYLGGISCVADLDMDGSPEIVAGKSAYHADGSLYWNSSILYDGFPAVGNFDDDDFPEIVVVCRGLIYLLEHTGDIKWGPIDIPGYKYVPGGITGGPPTIADFDGDGEPEIGVAHATKYVVFETDGSVKWESITNDDGSAMTGSSVFDFDGDGSSEIVYGDQEHLWIFRGTDGEVLYKLPKSSGTVYEYPVVADVDADGNAEIIVSSSDSNPGPGPGIIVIGDLNDTWVPTRKIWNQHSYHVTNVNDDGTIPLYEENSWETHNTFRCNLQPGMNPFDAPNLLPCYVRYTIEGQNITYTVRIANNGSLLAPADILVSFYDGDSAEGGTYLGTAETTAKLDPGHFEDVTITLPQTDINNLWIWADDDGTGTGQVSECDEDDNLYNPDFTIDTENTSPMFTSNPPASATVGQLYRYDVSAIDADGDELMFDLPASPEGMAVVADSGIVVWTPDIDQLGWQNVMLRVSDGHGGIDLQSFKITVGTGNTSPVVTSSPLTIATVDVVYEYAVLAQDAEGDELTFDLSTAPAGMIIDPSTGLINWTPAASQAGIHTIGIVVSDGFGGTASQYFDVTVVTISVNEPPHIISTPRMITEVGLAYAYQVEATDGNGDSLTYSLNIAPAGMTINETGLVQWIPTTEQFGLNNVRIHVEDGRGGLAYQEFSINVVLHATNNTPVITSIPVFVVALGQSYTYDAQATDDDGDPLVWTLETAPAGMSADPLQGTVRWTPTAAQLGINEVTLKVIDAQGAWASQIYTVNVQTVNTPPNITSTPLTNAYVGYQYIYAVNAVDPEGNTLLFSLTASPAGMTIDPTTGMLQWTPDAGQIGQHSVVIRAEDTAGGYATQSYAIEVIADVPNNPPTITSMPSGLAIADALYQYEVQAVDPESDSLTFSLEIAPTGMTIDPATGLIQWTSTLAQIGDNFVKIVATDTAGNAAFQSFAISVVNGNNHPVITSAPQSPAYANDTWAYDITASDPDGDLLSYSLEQAPAGMTVDEFGRVRWTPTATDVGPHTVEVLAADIYGAAASQTFTLTVVVDTSLPTISLAVNENPIALGSDLIITAWATDNVGIESMFITFDGASVSLNGNGQAILTMNTVGSFEITMSATDTSGNQRSGSLMINVFDPNPDPNPPFVEITSPAYGDAITNIIDVIGTVEDDNLSYYILEIARADKEVYTEIARGTTTVAEGLLGKFDPTVLANDTYLLSLTAVDTSGNTSYSTIEVNVEGSLKIGNFTLSFTDLSIPVSGIPITVTRTYDSLNANTQNDLGYGWRLELKDTDLTTSVPDTGYEDMGFFNAFYYGTKVYVTTPDGKRQGFTFTPDPPRGWGESFLGIYHPAFTPNSGVTSRLNVEDIYLQYVESTGEFIFYGSGWPYNPADTEFTNGTYTLSTAEGINYTIDALDGDLNVISETNGNSLTFTEDAIISSAGPRVEIERDPYGRITAVIDPAGNRVEYGYDANGDLVTVTDREGNLTEFVYLSDPAHYLDQIIDPLGRTGIRNEYDDQGRIIRMIDVNGNAVELVHDPDNFVETVVDSLGNATIYEYDDRGNVLTEVDALGNTKRYSYDNKNHSLTETDPLGNITTYTRDGNGNALTVTDPLGNTTYNTYGTYNRLLATTGPLGNTTTNAYDGSGNLLSTTDAVGNVTTYTYDSSGNQTSVTDALDNTTISQYDSSGNMISSTDPLGNETTYTYDVNGNMISQTDALGNTTTYTYNANGQVVSTTDALGNVTTTEYNEIGKEVARIDALGNVTESVYDDRGQLTQTIGPDGSVVQTEYDAAGRRISSTNPLGQTTQYEYDVLGRTLRTVNPDGSTSQTEYDAAGRSIAMIDALGNRTEFEYDAAGRIIATDYPDGTTMQVEYDTAGRRVSSTDRAGQTTIYEHDALGRTIQTILPDGSSSQTEYDAAGRTIAQVNALDSRSEYVFDAAGRNTSVIDALGNVTEYAYDAAGRRISMTDANGNTTTFAYDALGRQIQVIYPDGTSATTTYDAIGRKVAETDQAGNTTSFEYDSMGHLIRVTDALSNQTMYSYDPAGNRLTQTDANDNTTSFVYDSMNRQISRILPMGQTETMHYNAAGSMISKTDFNGDTITRQYDSSNRLISKNLPDGTSVEFTYTSTGQQQTITDSRGLTTFDYDSMGRLTGRIDPDSTSISYTYDLAGNRTSVTTPTGTTDYTFDALNRMETVTAPDGGVTSYTYDAVGNRSVTVNPNGSIADYTYDSLNRLTYLENRKSTSEIISSYAYTLGPAGNRIHVVEDTGRTVDYTYDNLYRLIEEYIDNPVSGVTTIAYTYDAVGNRLTRTITTASSVTTAQYSYDGNDRLLTENQTVAYTQLMLDKQEKYYANAYGVSGKPSAASTRMIDGFLSVSLAGLLVPFCLLLPWGKDLSRRQRRRRIITLTILLLTVPMFGIGQENLWAMNTEANLYRTLSALAATDITDPVSNSYTYDNNGNTRTKTDGINTDTYTYDYENHMISADIQIGAYPVFTAYTYDASGIRTSKTADGVTIAYTVDKNRPYAQVLEEYDGTDTVSYVYGDDLISMTRPTGTSYYHYDGHMSTRNLTDNAEASTDTYTYDAFGNLLASTGSTINNYRYTGEQYDPNAGFYYLRARYYNQSVGRFTSMDPFQGTRFDPMSLHKYLYAHANPVMNIDPTGLFSIIELMIVTKVISIVFVNYAIPTVAFGYLFKKAFEPGFCMRNAGLEVLASGNTDSNLLKFAWELYDMGNSLISLGAVLFGVANKFNDVLKVFSDLASAATGLSTATSPFSSIMNAKELIDGLEDLSAVANSIKTDLGQTLSNAMEIDQSKKNDLLSLAENTCGPALEILIEINNP